MTGLTRRRGIALVGLLALGAAVPLGLLGAGNSAASKFSASHQLGSNRVTTASVDLIAGRNVTTAAGGVVAPGARQLLEVVATNAGTLPLLVTVSLLPDDSPTSEALTWEYWDGDCEDRPASELVSGPSPPSPPSPPSAPSPPFQPPMSVDPGPAPGLPLAAGEAAVICVAAVLPLDASNELQGGTAIYEILLYGVHDIDRS